MNKEDLPESTRKKGNMVTKMESSMSETFSQLWNLASVVDRLWFYCDRIPERSKLNNDSFPLLELPCPASI